MQGLIVRLSICAIIELCIMMWIKSQIGMGWALGVSTYGFICSCRGAWLKAIAEERKRLVLNETDQG